jgi:hypothetical protein
VDRFRNIVTWFKEEIPKQRDAAAASDLEDSCNEVKLSSYCAVQRVHILSNDKESGEDKISR